MKAWIKLRHGAIVTLGFVGENWIGLLISLVSGGGVALIVWAAINASIEREENDRKVVACVDKGDHGYADCAEMVRLGVWK